MEEKNLKEILTILNDVIKNNKCKEDNLKINNLYNTLLNLNSRIISVGELDNIMKDVIDLEVKYDELNELSYYFDPVYISIKNNIHNIEAQKIREENRKKRGGK